MKANFYFSISLAALLALPFAFGCNNPELLSSGQGDYRGFLIRTSAMKVSQESVTAKAQLSGKNSLKLVVNSVKANKSYEFKISSSLVSSLTGSVKVESTDKEPLFPSQSLKQEKDGCLIAKSDKSESRICYTGSSFELDFSRTDPELGPNYIKLVMDRFDPTQRLPDETPSSYTLEQLMTRAMDQSFASQTQFYKTKEAHHEAVLAEDQLVPHFDAATALRMLSLNIYTMLRTVGDLAPFVLPGNWFKANEAGHFEKAENVGLRIVKADTANIAEGLIYSTLYDKDYKTRLEADAKQISELIVVVRNFIANSGMQVTTANKLEFAQEEIGLKLRNLEKAYSQQLASLAQTVGFVNPSAISEVIRDASMPSIEDAQPIDLEAAKNEAISVSSSSLELRQMAELREGAQVARNARFFEWMDPTHADKGGQLGLGYLPYIEIGNDKIDIIDSRKADIQGAIEKKVANVIEEIDLAVEQYRIAKRKFRLADDDLLRIKSNLELAMIDPKMPLSMSDIENAVRDRLEADLQVLEAQTAYSIALSRLNRLTLQGPYYSRLRGGL